MSLLQDTDDEIVVKSKGKIVREIRKQLKRMGILYKKGHVRDLHKTWIKGGLSCEIPVWIRTSNKCEPANGGVLCTTLGGRKSISQQYQIIIFEGTMQNPIYRRRFTLREDD